MRSRKYVLSLLGATAVVAAGAGAAAAATGSTTTTTSKPAVPSHAQRRHAPNMGSGHCPHMDSGPGSSSGTAGPAVPSYAPNI